jgi:hypothetical protein
MAFKDTARRYSIEVKPGVVELLASVTTGLSIIDKSAPLMHWAVNRERMVVAEAIQRVFVDLEALVGDPEKRRSDFLKAVHGGYDAFVGAISGAKAMVKANEEALMIGTAAHAMIEWLNRKQMGEKVGPEPKVPDAALLAVEAFKDWAKAVDFTPLVIERVVYCAEPECYYAGTFDFIALVQGIRTLGDFKTSRAIYTESFLQNIAYRHAAEQCGMPTEQGIILRLPKTLEDPAFEAMPVPPTDLEDFRSCLRLWRWRRRMEGRDDYAPPESRA